jgi:hypothetical protein
VGLLILKLILSPGLIAGVTLATRRWGPIIGGWLAGMPVMAGPTLFFIAIEHGDAFAARAAGATLVALMGVAAFCLVYARMSVLAPWPPSLLAGWIAFAAVTLLLNARAWEPVAALGASWASYAAAGRLLPREPGRVALGAPPAWDLPLRMASAVALVLAVTHFAAELGPSLSGALTPFPVAISILAAFTHAQQGSGATIRFIRAFLPAMWSFSLFCFAVALALVPLGHGPGFAVAVLVQLAAHGAVLGWIRATGPASWPRWRWPWRWRMPSS